MNQEELKKQVGVKAAEIVENDMIVGLGTGSTIAYTIQELGNRVKEGLAFSGIATSKDTEEKATKAGIHLVDINDVDQIDLAIDGADEVDADLNLIKGGGGALTREKIIGYLAERFVILVDESKIVETLGAFAVSVEVLPFAWVQTQRGLQSLGGSASARMTEQGELFTTDNGNYIVDVKFSHIPKPASLEKIINNIPGVVENGVFRSDMVSEVWVSKPAIIDILKE